MKVQARVSETGRLVAAHDDADWAFVHPVHGPRPILYCPERACHNRVSVVERTNGNGEITRFFRFQRNVSICVHAEVDQPHVVRSGSTPGESAEHQWLKAYVFRVAADLGYEGVGTEVRLGRAVRADVFVPSQPYGRVEVQRGPTNLPARTELYGDVVWLLRQAYSAANTWYLFHLPCVQVRVVRRIDGRLISAEPWLDGIEAGLEVRAGSTVLKAPRIEPASSGQDYFENETLPLDTFLAQVWAGQRRWDRRSHRRFAGWITVEDQQRFWSWQAMITSATPPAPRPADVEVPAADVRADAADEQLSLAGDGSADPADVSGQGADRPGPPPSAQGASPLGHPPLPVETRDRSHEPAGARGSSWWRRAIDWLLGR